MAKRVTRRASEETRRKMSAAHKGAKNGMYKRKHTATSKRLISEALLRYWQHIPKT
jgi:ribosomal protein L32